MVWSLFLWHQEAYLLNFVNGFLGTMLIDHWKSKFGFLIEMKHEIISCRVQTPWLACAWGVRSIPDSNPLFHFSMLGFSKEWAAYIHTIWMEKLSVTTPFRGTRWSLIGNSDRLQTGVDYFCPNAPMLSLVCSNVFIQNQAHSKRKRKSWPGTINDINCIKKLW